MKRRWKVFWLVCACLAVAGVVLCSVGVVMGATFYSINETFISEAGFWDEAWDAEWNDGEAGDMENRAGELAAENSGASEYITEYTDVKKMDLQMSYAYVKVESYDGNSVFLDTGSLDEQLREKLRIETDESSGELKIKTVDKSLWRKLVNTDRQSGRIVIRVPENNPFEEASFEVGAGLLRVEKIYAENLKMNVGAGEAIVKSFGADELEAECGAGKATLTGAVSRKASVDCGVGQITLNLPGKQTDYNYEVEYGIGEMKVGESSYSGMGHEQQIYNSASKDLKLECGIGSVEVNFDEK